MELSPAVIEWCKREALGQCLTQWGKDSELPYDEVIEALESAYDNDVDVYDTHGIMLWEQYEDEPLKWVANQIESLYDSYICCAEFALGWDTPNEEGFTPRALNALAEQIEEDN